MTKRHSDKYRICRQLGENLWGHSSKKYKADKTPGEHGKKHRKNPDNRYEPLYSTQLREKQKIKKYYANIGEKQFRHYFDLALKIKGPMYDNLLSLLESRIDTIIYRTGFAKSMFEARQMVNHGHVMVNNKVINTASQRLHEGDVFSVKNSLPLTRVVTDIPAYLEMDSINQRGIFLKKPSVSEVPLSEIFNIKSIIEFYSR